jgi:pimeloyl-ACP methyl ester carboxylesterase
MKKTETFDEKNLAMESSLKKWGSFININGIDSYVIEEGNGENIIFINGIAANVYNWRKVFNILKESFHVYSMDFKGSGFSEKPPGEYSIDIFMKQIIDLYDHFGMRQSVIVGNSLGGEVALQLAINYPEKIKALILIDTAGYQENKEITRVLVRLSRYKVMAKILEICTTRKLAKKLVEGALYNDKIIDREMVDAYYKPMRTEGAVDALIELIKDLSYTAFDYSKVRSIESPTLIIWGEEDRWIPVADGYRFHKDIQGSKLVVLKNCGHAPQEEMPEVVSKLITDFINEIIK